MASTTLQVCFEGDIDVVERTDLALNATDANAQTWAEKRIARFERALAVYQDAVGRIGAIIQIAGYPLWRVRLAAVRYTLSPLAVILALDLYHSTQTQRARAEYVVDSLDDYSLARLQAWLQAWAADRLARFTAGMTPDAQATLERVIGE
jgi:hypothetical protein